MQQGFTPKATKIRQIWSNEQNTSALHAAMFVNVMEVWFTCR